MCFSIFGIYASCSLHHSSLFVYQPPPAPFNSCVTSYLASYHLLLWLGIRSFFIIPIQLHHQLLLLYPLPLLNGVFAISPPSNSFMYLIYMWNLRKGWINDILAFYLRLIQCLLLIWSSYSLMACYYLDCVRLIF